MSDDYTFAEVPPDMKMQWLSGYIDMLAARAFTAQYGDRSAIEDLGSDLEMTAKLLQQIRRQVVDELNALTQRLEAHGDYVVPMVSHKLTVRFEPDDSVPEKDAPVTRRE